VETEASQERSQQLKLFLRGAFARMGPSLQEGFRASGSGEELWFHRFVPSGMLAAEIIGGADADIYVSANRRFMDQVAAAGQIVQRDVLAGNRLCIIVRSDSGDRVATLEDFARPGVPVVSPQAETDPCGQYVELLFERAGIAEEMRRKADAGDFVRSVGSGDLPDYLADRRVAAGILYESEARALGNAVTTIALPRHLDLREEIAFHIGVVGREGHSKPSATAFFEFMLSPAGREIMNRFGFLPPA
jgi:molybdate transport system substrate-binding protein